MARIKKELSSIDAGIKRRVLQYLLAKGYSKADFQRMTGLSNGYLDNSGTIESDKLSKIFGIFDDINRDYIMFGTGEPALSLQQYSSYDNESPRRRVAEDPYEYQNTNQQILHLEVINRYEDFNAKNRIPRFCPFGKKIGNTALNEQMMIVRVSDAATEPEIEKGEYIFVEKLRNGLQGKITPDKYYLIVLKDGKAGIRRISLMADGNIVRLEAANEDFVQLNLQSEHIKEVWDIVLVMPYLFNNSMQYEQAGH